MLDCLLELLQLGDGGTGPEVIRAWVQDQRSEHRGRGPGLGGREEHAEKR